MPVYSTDTMAEAEELLVAACPRNLDGDFIAEELVECRDLDSLEKFSLRLARLHRRIQESRAEKQEP